MLRKSTFALSVALGAVLYLPSQAGAAPAKKKDADILKIIQNHTIRGVDFDVCYPATDEEYQALGKNAVVMLTASSVSASELPLKTAYVVTKGVRVPLQKLAAFDKHQTADGGANHYTEQVSFYLLPIYLMKKDAELEVDFNGPRSGFGVTTFSAHKGLETGVPAFIRLDDYDSPTDPDMAAVAALLEREYPVYFNTSEAR